MQLTIHALTRLKRLAMPVICLMGLLLLSGCAVTNQLQSTTQTFAINLEPEELKKAGIAFITPSSATGQEEDRQALALSFTAALKQARPDLRIMSLPETLGAINGAGLASEYRHMYEDYRLTGIFNRDTLQKVSRVTGIRYLAQLKLGGFRQEAKNRFGTSGLRIVETKTTNLRLFFQIWDGENGLIAWEGSQEITASHESVLEDAISFKTVVEQSANELIARLP